MRREPVALQTGAVLLQMTLLWVCHFTEKQNKTKKTTPNPQSPPIIVTIGVCEAGSSGEGHFIQTGAVLEVWGADGFSLFSLYWEEEKDSDTIS